MNKPYSTQEIMSTKTIQEIGVLTAVVMMSTIFWDQHITFMFSVEEAERDTKMKAACKPNSRRYFARIVRP
jgi:hypothetical protein